VTASTDNPRLLPSATVAYTSPEQSGLLNLTLAADQSGSATVAVSVTDGISLTSRTFRVDVLPVNDAPIFTSTPRTEATDDSAYTYAISTSDADAGDSLAISAPTLPEWLQLEDAGDGTATLRGTPTDAHVGAHPVVLQVQDSAGASATQEFSITVGNANDAPSFTSTPPTTATVGISYTYAISTSDADAGNSLTISAPTLPEWLQLEDAGDGTATLRGTPTDSLPETHPVVLRVQDSAGASATQAFSISITMNSDRPAENIYEMVWAMVGVEGGSVVTADGAFALRFPPGAVQSTVIVSLTMQLSPTLPISGAAVIHSFVLEIRDSQSGQLVTDFEPPLVLLLEVDSDFSALQLFFLQPPDSQAVNLNTERWHLVAGPPGTSIEVVDGKTALALSRVESGEFALVGQQAPPAMPGHVFLPLVLR
jgi:hypothetical protein